MNLILIEDYKDNWEKITSNISKKGNKFEKFDNWKNLDLTEYKDIYAFVAIQNNFVSPLIQDFVINCKFPIKFITLSPWKNMSDPFISWLNSYIYYFKADFKICARIRNCELDDDIEIINNMIANNTKEPKDNVVIYTDGACSGNPGPGGWGAVLLYQNKEKRLSGYEEDTTNNRMEITAVVQALSALKMKCNVEVYSDSAYVVNAFNQNWIDGWRKNGWKNSDKESIKNIELWHELDRLTQYHNVTFNKVKGHSDDEYNNICDALATGEISKHQSQDN